MVEGRGILEIARGRGHTGVWSKVLDNWLGMVICPSLVYKWIAGIAGIAGMGRVVSMRGVCGG